VRLAVADDSTLFRHALTGMLSSLGFDVVVEAGRGDELLARLAETPVDVVLLDIRMPPTHTEEGLVAAEEIRRRDARTGILVLSTYPDGHYAERVISLGDRGIGYLLKDRVDDTTALADALRRVANGEFVVDPVVVSALLARQRTTRTLERLSERERVVLALMAEGRSNAGIAEAAGVSAKTVEKQVASVFDKLDLVLDGHDNRRVLAVLAWLRATAASGARPSDR
jgi:DNA-binding NarL/FixJ family response regulator